MKKIIAIIVVIIILSNANLNVVNGDNKTKLYPTTMVVVNVENDIVTLEDFNGECWEFEGAEDWMVNDICACIMNDNATEEIYDDEIVKIKYCGFVD